MLRNAHDISHLHVFRLGVSKACPILSCPSHSKVSRAVASPICCLQWWLVIASKPFTELMRKILLANLLPSRHHKTSG